MQVQLTNHADVAETSGPAARPHMILLRRGPLRIAESWLEANVDPALEVDLHRFVHVEQPVGMNSACEHTLTIDLRNRPDLLMDGMSKDVQRAIRRAHNDGVNCRLSSNPNDQMLADFETYHNEFAKQKHRPPLELERLLLLLQNGMLGLSNVTSADGTILAWHCYVCATHRVRLLYSASLFRNKTTSCERNAAGRAHRYLHWNDIVNLRDMGFHIYDFGGWYPGNEDTDRLQINRFKEAFGGHIDTTYRSAIGLTFLGKAALALRHTQSRLGIREA